MKFETKYLMGNACKLYAKGMSLKQFTTQIRPQIRPKNGKFKLSLFSTVILYFEEDCQFQLESAQ